MTHSIALFVSASLMGMCMATSPSPSAAWPANAKKGCLLLNKRNNFTDLTDSCDSKVCTPGDDADPKACSQCEGYDAALKVRNKLDHDGGRAVPGRLYLVFIHHDLLCILSPEH